LLKQFLPVYGKIPVSNLKDKGTVTGTFWQKILLNTVPVINVTGTYQFKTKIKIRNKVKIYLHYWHLRFLALHL
jgi:hypothetical protein